VLYAGVLADSRLRDVAQARVLLERLKTVVGQQPAAARQVGLLAAEIEWAAEDLPRTAAALDALDPKLAGRTELLMRAQLRIRQGQPAEAMQRLQARVALDPRDATAWQLLAAAYNAQGQTLRAIRAEAEQQVARLDYSGALDRFKAAQNFVRSSRTGTAPMDHIEASIIDTRTRQVESLVREQALER
jgi:predicted Zn-dependent protease